MTARLTDRPFGRTVASAYTDWLAGTKPEAPNGPVRKVKKHMIQSVPHIAVVDDEAEIRALLCDYLTGKGYRVTALADGAQFRALMTAEPIDLVLLDVNMPGEDGFSIARSIRETSTMGVLMVTSAADVFDRVVGLEVGADDYVTKPFALDEIAARVHGILRRMARQAEEQTGRAVRFGDWAFDGTARTLTGRQGHSQTLSESECALLQAFADHPDEVLSRDQLLDLAGDDEADAFDRSIDVRIARIRRKIEGDPAKPQVIKTIRGAGYKFVIGRGG